MFCDHQVLAVAAGLARCRLAVRRELARLGPH